jgi:hypothetical protein
MSDDTFTAYLVTVRRKRTKESLQLGNIDGEPFRESFEKFLQETKSRTITNPSSDGEETVSRSRRGWVLDSHSEIILGDFVGVYRTAFYGYAGDIIDMATLDKSGRVTKTQGISVPLHFRLKADSQATKAVIVFHRWGNLTAYPEIAARFPNWYSDRHKGLVVEINPVTSAKAMEAYLNSSNIKNFTLRKYASNSFAGQSPKPYSVSQYSLTIHAPKRQFFPSTMFSQFLKSKGRFDPSDIFEVLSGNEKELARHIDPSEVLIDLIDKEGRPRTINFGKDEYREIFLPAYPIGFDDDGYMVPSSFLAESNVLVDLVLEKLKKQGDSI